MAQYKISSYINCKNIAPLTTLNAQLDTNSLKTCVFAANGSGKTFISRMFRLTELDETSLLPNDNYYPTNKLLTLGEDEARFEFKTIRNTNNQSPQEVLEDFEILLKRDEVPTIPPTNYLFHTFNSDYVEENLSAQDYDKDGVIDGYILGKGNIDIEDEKKLLESTSLKYSTLDKLIDETISTIKNDKLNTIQFIKTITEYKQLLATSNIRSQYENGIIPNTKDFAILLEDFNKLKSVPEGLKGVEYVPVIGDINSLLENINDNLSTIYSLSKFSDDFKVMIESRKNFILDGLKLFEKEEDCPFCRQNLRSQELSLIDKYSEYINDQESVILRVIVKHLDDLSKIEDEVNRVEMAFSKSSSTFNQYKSDYIPSFREKQLIVLDFVSLKNHLGQLRNLLELKMKDISKVVELKTPISEIITFLDFLNEKIKENNKNFELLNKKLLKIGDEQLDVKRELCKSTYNEIINAVSVNLIEIKELSNEIISINKTIKDKQESQKVEKRQKVASTIKKILNFFFQDKYSLNEETFRLTFQNNVLEQKQAKDVLSDGEKSIIAFAYYIGDVHLKIDTEDDYKKLYFIIDDPISSMDYNYVYSLVGLIRNIDEILDNKLQQKRLLILTHNSEFHSLLIGNKIVDNPYYLRKNEIIRSKAELSTPYISHLLDIYSISTNSDRISHTTANSIRHIIETLTKFEHLESNSESIRSYLKNYFGDNIAVYSLLNDLSHGGWRTEQLPIEEDRYKDICNSLIEHIESKYPGQISFCQKWAN